MKKLIAISAIGVVSAFAQAPAQPSPAAVATSAAGSSVQNATAPAVGRRRTPPPRPQGPTPHLADGTVDLSGVWNGGGPVGDVTQGIVPKGAKLSMTPAGERIFKSRQSKDDPEANCLPTGVPRISPYPWRMVQDKTHVWIIYEGNIHSYRQIFTDGRKHKDDPDPTWYGESIGHYEGDTLVVDTIGYNDKFWFDFNGHPHSESLHTIERYTRKDLGTLQVDTKIIDPVMYTEPFDISFTFTLQPREELMEYICQENQQDAKHLIGFTGLQ